MNDRSGNSGRCALFAKPATWFLGPPGVGKTGRGRGGSGDPGRLRSLFHDGYDLVTDFGRAYQEGRLDRRMRIYLTPEV
jgi:hypothetical protein